MQKRRPQLPRAKSRFREIQPVGLRASQSGSVPIVRRPSLNSRSGDSVQGKRLQLIVAAEQSQEEECPMAGSASEPAGGSRMSEADRRRSATESDFGSHRD